MNLRLQRIKKTAGAAIDLVKEVVEDPTKYIENASSELQLQRNKICATCAIRTGNQCDPTKCVIVNNEKICGCGCYLPVAISRMNKQCPRKIWPGEEHYED